jgi:hypothetical protein
MKKLFLPPLPVLSLVIEISASYSIACAAIVGHKTTMA